MSPGLSPLSLRVRLDVGLQYIHKQVPLDDEELRCRDGAETLVGGDEEEGAHPGIDNTKKILSNLFNRKRGNITHTLHLYIHTSIVCFHYTS